MGGVFVVPESLYSYNPNGNGYPYLVARLRLAPCRNPEKRNAPLPPRISRLWQDRETSPSGPTLVVARQWSFRPTLPRIEKNTSVSLDKQPRHAHTRPMNKPDYLSYSQMTTFLSCGEKYRLTRIVGVEEEPAWYFIGGSALHTAADAVDYALLEGK